MRGLLLLSGGLDSATILATHRHRIEAAICFDYQQPHGIEISYAREIARKADVEFIVRNLPPLPLVDDVVFAARNAIMLTVAAAVAIERGFDYLLIGCNASDAERFPDCRREFVAAMDAALYRAYGLAVEAPLLGYTKAEVRALAARHGVTGTWSCYRPAGDQPCGQCLACRT